MKTHNEQTQPRCFYIALQVEAAGYERYDKPVEVELNFTQLLEDIVDHGAFNDRSLFVVEVDTQGTVLDDFAAFQFDRSMTYNASTHAAGTLICLLKGTTPANSTRHFRVYFDTIERTYTMPEVSAQVTAIDHVEDEEQESVKIVTQNATYFYHKLGAGFSSMIDEAGYDWLNYHPGGGSAGEYRGIPNMGHPEGYCHPGQTVSQSRLIAQGPVIKMAYRVSRSAKRYDRNLRTFDHDDKL